MRAARAVAGELVLMNSHPVQRSGREGMQQPRESLLPDIVLAVRA